MISNDQVYLAIIQGIASGVGWAIGGFVFEAHLLKRIRQLMNGNKK